MILASHNLKHKILDVKWLLYHVSVSLRCRQVLHSGTIALCSGTGFQKRHTFQWNAGLGQKSTGWCEFRNLCTAFWSCFGTHTHPVESQVGNIGIPTQPGIQLDVCLFRKPFWNTEQSFRNVNQEPVSCSGSHSGMSPLVEPQVRVGILHVAFRNDFPSTYASSGTR